VNGNAANIVAYHFALAGMEPSTDFDPKRPDFLGYGAGAAHAAAGPSKVARKPSPVVLIS
jgi:hypothetical protein